MDKKSFITSDVWLAAALVILLQRDPEFSVRSGRTLFLFPSDEHTFRAISQYNDGVELNVFKFSEIAKKLKFEAISRRSMQFEGSKVSA